MISYLYSLDYMDKPSVANIETSEGRLVVNARVYAIAEKYMIESLKELAKQKTLAAISDEWNSESFLTALEIVWNGTPASDRALRACYVTVVVKHRNALRKKEAFLDIMRANRDLSFDVVLESWGTADVSIDPLKCCICGEKDVSVCKDCYEQS